MSKWNIGPFDVAKEAIWALSNATEGGNATQIEYMVQQGALNVLADALKFQDPKLLLVAMDAISNILRHDPQRANMLDNNGGLDTLESLQTHPSHDVYAKALEILERFFSVEEVDDQNNDLAPTDNTFSFNFGDSSRQ